MEKVLTAVLSNLDMMTITGKDAERMAAIKSMIRELLKAAKNSSAKEEKIDE